MSDIARRRFLQATAIGGAASAGLLPSAQAQSAAPAPLNVGGPSTPLPAFKAPDVVRPLHIADLNDLEAAAKAVNNADQHNPWPRDIGAQGKLHPDHGEGGHADGIDQVD